MRKLDELKELKSNINIYLEDEKENVIDYCSANDVDIAGFLYSHIEDNGIDAFGEFLTEDEMNLFLSSKLEAQKYKDQVKEWLKINYSYNLRKLEQ